MTISIKHWDNGKYGFPDGRKRRITPVALACIHITANKNTASNPDLHEAALDEWRYARGAAPPSAHYYIARDGWAIEAIDPVLYAAWSNGDVNEPNRDNPGILRVLRLRREGYNANEAYWLEFENVGHGPSGHPITSAQKQAMAEIIAVHAKRTGKPINRETVHGHWEINGVDRWSCPSPAGKHESLLNDVIARANLILNPPPPPEPEPPEGEPMVIVTDKSLLEIDIRVGAIITDLNGERLVDVATQAWRPSPFGTEGHRAVVTYFSGSTKLGLVADADILGRREPALTQEQIETATAEAVAAAVGPLNAQIAAQNDQIAANLATLAAQAAENAEVAAAIQAQAARLTS